MRSQRFAWRRELKALMRFGSVGLLTTTLDFVIFMALATSFLAAAPANVISYSCGIAVSYVLNSRYTFHSGRDPVQALRFALMMLAGLALSTCVIWMLGAFAPAVYAKCASVPVVFAWNFLASRHWVFNRST